MIVATARPNVALIKYWGKQDDALRIPATPSLSIPLLAFETRTSVERAEGPADRVIISGQPDTSGRIEHWLATLRRDFRLDIPPLCISSHSNFPASSGLASSASGFAALTRALDRLLELELDEAGQSLLARIGSASAARSVRDDFMVLAGETGTHESWYARKLLDWSAWPLGVSVVLCSRENKHVSSSAGMRLGRETSPLFGSWTRCNRQLFAQATDAVRERDFDALAQAARWSFFAMLSVMQSSTPALCYLNRASCAVIEAVGELQEAGVPVFFTCDAGAQVKCVYPPENEALVRSRIERVAGVLEVLRACP